MVPMIAHEPASASQRASRRYPRGMRSNRTRSSWSRRKLALYSVGVVAIFVAVLALSYALDIRDRGAAAVLVTAGMGVFSSALFLVFVVRSLKAR